MSAHSPDEGTIRTVLTLASRAPSVHNTQPWRFVVVSGAVRDRVRETIAAHREIWVARVRDKFPPSMTQRMDQFFATLGDAPAVVFVYADQALELDADNEAGE